MKGELVIYTDSDEKYAKLIEIVQSRGPTKLEYPNGNFQIGVYHTEVKVISLGDKVVRKVTILFTQEPYLMYEDSSILAGVI